MEDLSTWKFGIIYGYMSLGRIASAFFAFQFLSMFLALISGLMCWIEPPAAGSGIPEIIAFLNGINLSNAVNFRVLVLKVFAMSFSVAAGLPIGKEGPMIHAGSIIGAVVSQGYSCSIGFDNSWKRFQGFRNDATKRDFVTYGAAAGISGAFRAPIGGILMALEEGASFWSSSVTLRAFICAVITQLTISVLFIRMATSSSEMFAFGQFDNLKDGSTNFNLYEVPIFFLIGVGGGFLGVLFNYINKVMSEYRISVVNKYKWKRLVELLLVTVTMSLICFIFSISWNQCTPMPVNDSTITVQELDLQKKLVQFQCPDGKYNQLASLFMVSGDTATRQLVRDIISFKITIVMMT